MGSLYFGDNLNILREYIKDESINLVYLDPPFNSKRDYNVYLKTPKGHESDAQITAFDDTWHWGEQAEREFSELLHQQNTDVAEMIRSLRRFLKESDLMAYLTMMANRLVELHRVLKLDGSLYLHCDPTASHYLKIVLDTVFGAENFKSEIIWKRSAAHGGAVSYNDIHDVILYYSKSEKPIWNSPRAPFDESYIESHYSNVDENGKRYQLVSAHGAGEGVPRKFGDKVIPPPAGRHWMSQEHIDKMMAEGKVVFTKSGMPRYKRFLDETDGVPLGTVWDDIFPINSQAAERLGYPTQKPLALLERILKASSNKGDVVLDPFCGCGTAVHSAQILERDWIGIDITHLAISLIEKRMKDAFPEIQFDVHGTPADFEGAKELAERDKYQFQWWACSLINAQPFQGKKKGSDGGIDGLIFFQDDNSGAKKIVVSVKGGNNVGVSMVKDLIATVENEKAEIGLFVTLAEPTKPMLVQAATAGFYQSPHMGEFPKIQILTIAELFSGKKPLYPDLSRGGLNFKKAKVEKRKTEQKKLL
ncbi:MAG: restriction endonuclease [Bacteroidia bacterium]|nr:restriction endonuclease [Bacteroidia bacterium]